MSLLVLAHDDRRFAEFLLIILYSECFMPSKLHNLPVIAI
jgi:hypothetical protein